MNNLGLAHKALKTTGKLNTSAVDVGGSYPFFTFAEYPLSVDSYWFPQTRS